MSKRELYIIVEGDVNDGDYITETSNISHLTKEGVIKLYETLVSYNPQEDSADEFYQYLPYMDNEELHTITSVDLAYIEYIDVKDL